MTTPTVDSQSRPRPHHAAVIGAAGGLGQGMLGVIRAAGISLAAIGGTQAGSRLTGRAERRISRRCCPVSPPIRPALTDAFAGAYAVRTAIGVTATTHERLRLARGRHRPRWRVQRLAARQTTGIVMINTLITALRGEAASRAMGVRLHTLEARNPQEIDSAFAEMARERAGALLVLPDSVFLSQRSQIAELR